MFKERIIGMVITALLKILTPDLIKDLINRVFDFVEEKVKGTKSTIDDNVVLPLIMMLRDAFEIRDDGVREMALKEVFSSISELFTSDLLKDFLDMLLDFIEDGVINSENTIDDMTVLPLCKMIRTFFDIPDND